MNTPQLHLFIPELIDLGFTIYAENKSVSYDYKLNNDYTLIYSLIDKDNPWGLKIRDIYTPISITSKENLFMFFTFFGKHSKQQSAIRK